MAEQRTIEVGFVEIVDGEAQTYGVELAEILEDDGTPDGKWAIQLVATRVPTSTEALMEGDESV